MVILEPSSDKFDDLLFVDWMCVINYKYFLLFVFFTRVEPFLMLIVDALQVVQRNGVLALARSLLYAFLADFGRALDVDHTSKINYLVHGDEVVVELVVYCMLSLIEDVHVSHDRGEDEAVREEGPFGDAHAPSAHSAILSPFIESAHEGIDLECEAPTFRLVIVEAEQINVA